MNTTTTTIALKMMLVGAILFSTLVHAKPSKQEKAAKKQRLADSKHAANKVKEFRDKKKALLKEIKALLKEINDFKRLGLAMKESKGNAAKVQKMLLGSVETAREIIEEKKQEFKYYSTYLKIWENRMQQSNLEDPDKHSAVLKAVFERLHKVRKGLPFHKSYLVKTTLREEGITQELKDTMEMSDQVSRKLDQKKNNSKQKKLKSIIAYLERRKSFLESKKDYYTNKCIYDDEPSKTLEMKLELATKKNTFENHPYKQEYDSLRRKAKGTHK